MRSNMMRSANKSVAAHIGVALMLATAAVSTPASAAIGRQDLQVASTPPAQSSSRSSSSLDFQVYTDWCEADQTQQGNWQVQLGYCLGYLQGLYWGQVISSPASDRPFCLPSAFQKSDVIAALDAYAEANPVRLSDASDAGATARQVTAAFKSYFKCD